MNRSILTVALACAIMTSAAPAGAIGNGTANLRVHATVRTICLLDFATDTVTPDAGQINLGTVTQLCNNRDGYRVVLQHPVGMTGANFILDGRVIPLSQGSETTLLDSDHPAFRLSEAQLELGSSDNQLDRLTFRIEPKGPVY